MTGRTYEFRGASRVCQWPMEAGARLGAAGMWNFLWRLGIHAEPCTIDRLPVPQQSILWAHLDEGTDSSQLRPLQEWLASGGYVVASGDAVAWSDVLGWPVDSWQTIRPENPYAGIAWQLPGRVAELIAPTRWPVSVCRRTVDGVNQVGLVSAVQGERQTPGRAVLVGLNTPAMVQGERYCFLNGHPFAAFQAWLQGQEDLQPWLAWRHRLFWLDEWVSSMADVLSHLPALGPELARPGLRHLAGTTVILRHDLDHSRDTSYLDAEVQRGWTATHGVLDDANTAFWTQKLGEHPDHECALHYNTGKRQWLKDARSRLRGSAAAPLTVSRDAVTGRGLHRQVQWAQAQQVGVASLLRHLSFQPYPEWVDALDFVFESCHDVRGGSSMFRAQTLRWGADGVDGATATVGDWPDAQSPLWFPFKLAHASEGRLLRGWECTSVMESEPELVDQLLSHRVAHLSQRVLTLGYHPAHAAGSTFHRDGSLNAFGRVLDVIAAHGAEVKTSREVFEAADATIREAGAQ